MKFVRLNKYRDINAVTLQSRPLGLLICTTERPFVTIVQGHVNPPGMLSSKGAGAADLEGQALSSTMEEGCVDA